MKNVDWKEIGLDVLVDIVAGMLIAVGVYNFALNANFPVAGFSGIAIIMYLNPTTIEESFLCLIASVGMSSMVISSVLMDYVAPLLPVYDGSRFLAALCMGVLCGIGYAMIFMRGSSTGGQDFISVSIKKVKPHITLGIITFVLDMVTIVLGTVLVFGDVDGLIYGIIVTYLMAIVMDRIMYGIDEGKLTLIVTERGEEVAERIDEYSGRGSTILKGMGSYSKAKKDVVMCACNNKQMYTIKKMVHKIDPKAFTIIMESNEVVGEGFKEEISEL